jgi:hypothetical protein
MGPAVPMALLVQLLGAERGSGAGRPITLGRPERMGVMGQGQGPEPPRRGWALRRVSENSVKTEGQLGARRRNRRRGVP